MSKQVAAPSLRFRIDPAWTTQAIEKACAFDAAKYVARVLSNHLPDLLPCISPILGRLAPVRLGHGNRMLRAWGRDYPIAAQDRKAIRLLVNGYYQGTRIVGLPAESFKTCKALVDGIIKSDQDMFWLEEPEDEKHKPQLLIFPVLEVPGSATPQGAAVSSAANAQDSAAGSDQKSKSKFKPKKVTQALMMLHEHPEWTDTQIAEAVGCERSSLYRMKGYKEARAALRRVRVDFEDWNQSEGRWTDEK